MKSLTVAFILFFVTLSGCGEPLQLDGWWEHPNHKIMLNIEGEHIEVFSFSAYGSSCYPVFTARIDDDIIVDEQGAVIHYELTEDGLELFGAELDVFNTMYQQSEDPRVFSVTELEDHEDRSRVVFCGDF